MIQSLIDTEIGGKEFDLIKNVNHIEMIFNKIKSRLSDYLSCYKEYISQDENTEMIKKLENADNTIIIKTKNKNPDNVFREKLLVHIKKVVNEFEKIKKAYDDFFDREKLEEYSFDISTFKSQLKKYCPVIRACCNSKSEIMKKWNADFKLSKPHDLYDVFNNIVTFGDEYNEVYKYEKYIKIDKWEDFGFDTLNEENHRLIGVIGTGIIATTLNALYPEMFPGHFRQGLYALYFLSEQKTFDMPSDTSEFIMVKDSDPFYRQSITLDHNFFFPYEVYSLYTLRIYRELDKFMKQWGVEFPQEYRYAITGDFYEFVCFNKHKEDIATLGGYDDIEKYGWL